MARSLVESSAMTLVALGRLSSKEVERVLAELGLSMRLVSALGHLTNSPELSYSDLARRAHVTPQSMRATVGHLEEIGAVRVEASGRGVPVQLAVTPEGRALLARAREAVADLDEAHFADMPDEVRAWLREAAVRLARRTGS